MAEKEALFEAIARAIEEGGNPDDLENEIWAEYGRTCAVMVLDSTGFSRTTQTRGIVYFLSVLARLRKIADDILKNHGVIDRRFMGDNIFAEFPDVDKALAAAFEIHAQIRKKNFPLGEDERFRACIGIGYGRLLESKGEGVYGDEMNLASKLGEDTAEGGETLLTEEAFLNLNDRKGIEVNRRFIKIAGVKLPYFSVIKE